MIYKQPAKNTILFIFQNGSGIGMFFCSNSMPIDMRKLLIFLSNLKQIAAFLRPEECFQQTLHRHEVDLEFDADHQLYRVFEAFFCCRCINNQSPFVDGYKNQGTKVFFLYIKNHLPYLLEHTLTHIQIQWTLETPEYQNIC